MPARSLMSPRSWFVALALVLGLLSAPLAAQVGCSNFQSHNFNMTSGGWWSNGTSMVAFHATTGSKVRLFCSIEFFVRARYGTTPVTVTLYDANGPWAPSPRVLGSGVMTVGTVMGVYKALFTTPIVVPPNTGFYIHFNQGTQIMWPVASSGITSTNYRLYFLNQWRTNTTPLPWSYRLGYYGYASTSTTGKGCGNGTPPDLAYPGNPRYGSTSFCVDIQHASPNSPGVLALGLSNRQWGSLALPLSMGTAAPGCTIYSAVTFAYPLTADPQGKCSFPLAIPKNFNLMGVTFYNQAFFVDVKANSLGVRMTNGGSFTIGV